MVPAWMSQALCGAFPTLPWIAELQDCSAAARASMQLVCGLCPVRSHCAEYVDTEPVVSGFWAGEHRTDQAAAARSDGAA